jgi:hypothetical protein
MDFNKRLIFVVLSVALAGCATGSRPSGEVGPFPSNYRELVAQHIRAEFLDPSSLQDVWIAPPYRARLMFTDGWMVCVRVNAKNAMGGYTGQQGYGYLIVNGVIVQEGYGADCPNQPFAEWTQMEGAGWKH